LISKPFLAMKKRLWLGTLALDALLLCVFALFYPQQLKLGATGMLLGLGYLWSLTFNAENPKKGIQMAFSTIRACLFAYALVQVSHGKANDLAIVIGGFLSYKVILTVDCAIQALSALFGKALVKTERPSV
jgi:hypothetical protein